MPNNVIPSQDEQRLMERLQGSIYIKNNIKQIVQVSMYQVSTISRSEEERNNVTAVITERQFSWHIITFFFTNTYPVLFFAITYWKIQ